MSESTKTRIAIVSEDLCKPKKCRQECRKKCPVNISGKLCIEVPSVNPREDVTPESKIATISEELCIGCGICVKQCPFGAIQIINLPMSLEGETTHRYGPNSFKLHRLPTPRKGQVLGLVGTNGIGKSTALKILAGKLQPNLGRYEHRPDWDEILVYFRGSELQNYLLRIQNGTLKTVVKPQYVEQISKAVTGTVRNALSKRGDLTEIKTLLIDLELVHLLDQDIATLSGGELQRFTIAMVYMTEADVYMFDEPSSYLDVKQRIAVARVIRSLATSDKYVIVVEHDLALLDYLSDYICCLYGVPGAYGVVTLPYSVREGINIFLAGFIPTENLRFRDTELTFRLAEAEAETLNELVERSKHNSYTYPPMTKTFTSADSGFSLSIEEGQFTESEIIVLLGENGMGKTTFIRLLAGLYPNETAELPELNVSYKPQMISPKFEGTVRQLLQKKIRSAIFDPQFQSDVMKPLHIESLMEHEVLTLSGGELQRVAIVIALGQPADVYLLDEPSTFLDAEQRIIVAKVIKRFIMNVRKTAFIVEHDFIMATYLADRVIVFEGVEKKEGETSRTSIARSPTSLLTGMNIFLRSLGVTYRRDPTNYRPRINKMDSVKDREQKANGTYFFLDE